jgi:AraC-like DNA-binding protein
LYRPGFINKNGCRISFGQAFNRTAINEISTELFEFHFFSHFYFKNKEASIADFANVMGVSKELIFNHVYQTYSMSFDELVNKNRIEYFVEIIKDPKFKNYTVEALALEVGFTSRQRFYQPFKKYHGGNPSDLIDVFGV